MHLDDLHLVAVATSDPSVVIPSAAVGVETQAACPQTAPALPTASSEVSAHHS